MVNRRSPEPCSTILYYNHGLRFQIAAQSSDGIEIPLIDGGAFDWVAKLTSNRRAAYVASGFGSQFAALVFRQPPDGRQ